MAINRRSEIARARKAIQQAKTVSLLIDFGYHEFSHGQYVKVSKAAAKHVVGLAPEELLGEFQLQWEGDNLYIGPAYSEGER